MMFVTKHGGGGHEHLPRRPARSHLCARDLQQQAAADLAGRPVPAPSGRSPPGMGTSSHLLAAGAHCGFSPSVLAVAAATSYTHVFLSIKVEWLLPLVSLQALHLLCSRRRSSTGLLGVGYLPAARPLIRRWRRCECCCVLCDAV